MLVISYLGNTYTFTKKDTTESEIMFRERCWWIVKNLVRRPGEIKMIIALSHVWVAIKYFGATYESHIMKTLETYEDVYITNN